jgi:hypothetical protein
VAANNLRSVLWESFEWFLVFTLLLIAHGSIAATEPSINPTTVDELKQLNDQTIIRTYVSLDSEWDHSKDGTENATFTLTGLWARAVSDSQDWGIRFRLPFSYHRTDQGSDDDAIGGVGDAEIGTGTAFRLNDTWRTAGGIELHTDTASDRALAERVWRLKYGWGVAHDFTKWLSANFNVDYNHSIAERDDVRPQRYLELSLPATLIFPQAWSINAKYKTAIDFQNGDRWNHMVGVGVAKRLSKVPIVLSATVEKSVSGGAKRFQANIGIVYYFQRYHSLK